MLSNLFLADDGGDGTDPDPEPEPDDNVIGDGEVRAELTGERFSETNYMTVLTSKAAKLTIEIYGGSGDADLYVKKDTARQPKQL